MIGGLNDISTFVGYLMLKPSLLGWQWCHLTHSLVGKGVHTIPKGIGLKVNVIARLAFEHTHFDIPIHHFSFESTLTQKHAPSENGFHLYQ